MSRIYVGTSGWNYGSWRGVLYPGVPRRGWLAHAARTFTALEINGSFYGQITAQTYRRWADLVPPGFRFSVKGHRFITHYKRLLDVGAAVDRVMAPAVELGDKLAAVLWQLPADFTVRADRLDDFLGHLAGWSQVRHAIEFRHRSWFTEPIAERLAAARVASCMSDAPDFPLWGAVTTDLVYVRLHGHTRKYASSYRRDSLVRWAALARGWRREGRDVHLYFDNDARGAAVRNAITLMSLVAEPADTAPELHP
jgi:uncharacterized protein YecE (DUF72 family)